MLDLPIPKQKGRCMVKASLYRSAEAAELVSNRISTIP
jgi:hypothetical protein